MTSVRGNNVINQNPNFAWKICSLGKELEPPYMLFVIERTTLERNERLQVGHGPDPLKGGSALERPRVNRLRAVQGVRIEFPAS